MNDQLLRLARETDVWCDQLYAGDEFYDLRWEEKFGELVVKTCIEQIRRVGILEDIEIEGDMIADAVQEYFGI